MKFDLIEMGIRKIPEHIKKCFCAGIIIGIITHLYMLTHKLPNWDDMNNLAAYGSGDYLGRWFLKYIHPLGGKFSVPAVHGMLAIIFIALSSCVILQIMDLKSTTAAILVPSIMITFPSVACTMTFMFTVNAYAVAIFMMCLSVYLIRRYKFGFVPGIALMICALGVYQSYISIAISLMLMGMIADLINGEKWLKVLKNGISYIVILLATVVIYLKLSHIIFPNLDNQTYGGIGSAGKITVSDMPILMARSYKRFLEFFIWKPFDFMPKSMQFANITVVLLGVITVIMIVRRYSLIKKWREFGLFLLCLFFMPWAVAFVYFMAPEAPYSTLMIYAYALIYVLVIGLWEKAEFKGLSIKIFDKTITLAIVLIMVLFCYSSYLITNTAYLRMEISYNRTYAYFNRILATLEKTEGYNYGDEACIAGEFSYDKNPSPIEIELFDSENMRDMSGVALENGLVTSGVRNRFMQVFLGFDNGGINDKQREELMKTEEYKAMPIYPNDGCIQKINDVWVVKLCENTDMGE